MWSKQYHSHTYKINYKCNIISKLKPITFTAFVRDKSQIQLHIQFDNANFTKYELALPTVCRPLMFTLSRCILKLNECITILFHIDLPPRL